VRLGHGEAPLATESWSSLADEKAAGNENPDFVRAHAERGTRRADELRITLTLYLFYTPARVAFSSLVVRATDPPVPFPGGGG
jgi:hypothetical protein